MAGDTVAARQVRKMQTRIHPPIRSVLDTVNFKLARIAALNQRLGMRAMRAELDLSLPEWRVLGTAHALAPATFQGICEALAMDKAQVSRALKELVRRGFVVTRHSAADARQLEILLTEEGAIHHAEGLATAERYNEADVADLSPEECRQFIDLLDRIAARVDIIAARELGGKRRETAP